MVSFIELTSEQAQRIFYKCPEPGDICSYRGQCYIIVRVNVINNSKLGLRVLPKGEVKHFDDFSDNSVEWEEFDESFFGEEKTQENDEGNFIDNNSLKEK